jgi:hypothetical protein
MVIPFLVVSDYRKWGNCSEQNGQQVQQADHDNDYQCNLLERRWQWKQRHDPVDQARAS